MLREVVEEPSFLDEFDLLRNSYPNMDDVHADITWTLGSDPRVGVAVQGFPHPTIRLFKITPIGNTPSFRVLYRFSHDKVSLIGIEQA
jgi:hypothetical protein